MHREPSLAMTRGAFFLTLALLLVPARASGQAPPDDGETAPVMIDPQDLGDLSWRHIGPAMFSGRISDVAGIPGNENLIYVGSASGGLYRSTNGGTTYEPIFEDGNTLSIGAIAVHVDDPDVIYVGTGEGAVRNSISYGDGIYKTTDGGRTWRHVGLRDSERFSRIVIDPHDPQIVFAAAMGHAFGPNEQRGVFRSTDGGESWEQVLYVDEKTGASDVAIDPENPDIVYAGMYQYVRQPWTFESGGPGSGLYRSTDGGSTWAELTDPDVNNGLPGAETIGRVGMSVHAADPRIVYALIESEEPGELWRSSDRGITWEMVNDERRLNNRPFYYTQVRADPIDPDRVYTLAGRFNISTDGGRTFHGHEGSMFGDHHALWIDPENPGRLYSGTDGGMWVSNDYGDNWDFHNNMPLAQAYHVGIDMAEPYNVLGGFQDHEIWRGPNEKWNRVGVREGDWVRLRYMADGMYTVPDPRDPDIIYYNGHFGDITRIDMRDQEERYIQPYPPGPNGGPARSELYRFNWNSPIHMSPTDPDVVYYGGNVLFRTTDGGETWDTISPDLTKNDRSKQTLSGGLTPDNTRAEYYNTILSIAESPRNPEVIWVGTDDGNVQVTRNGGETWTNVAPNIPDAPELAWVSSVAASHTDAGTAYITIDQHRLDDFEPYIFVTTDYGRTWRNISDGLRGYVHVVMEDPRQPMLLYAGTELGVFASFDRGTSWVDLRLGEPPVSVVDMKVHPRENDLVIATHARGFYILDDITPLQQLAPVHDRPFALFDPMPAVRYNPASDVSALGDRVWRAPNQPYGVIISYWLGETAGDRSVEVEILAEDGRLMRTLAAGGRPGVNRMVWNLEEDRAPCPSTDRGTPSGGDAGEGSWIRAVPGHYRLRLKVDGEHVAESTARVQSDPRIDATSEDYAVWYRDARKIEAFDCMARQAMSRAEALDSRLSRLERGDQPADVRDAIAEVREQLDPILRALSNDPGVVDSADEVSIARRSNWLRIQVGNNSRAPTAAQREWIQRFHDRAEWCLQQLEEIEQGSLARLNDELREGG